MHWEIAAGIAIVTGFGLYRIARDAYNVKDTPIQDPELLTDHISYGASYNPADAAIEGVSAKVGPALEKGIEAIAQTFHH